MYHQMLFHSSDCFEKHILGKMEVLVDEEQRKALIKESEDLVDTIDESPLEVECPFCDNSKKFRRKDSFVKHVRAFHYDELLDAYPPSRFSAPDSEDVLKEKEVKKNIGTNNISIKNKSKKKDKIKSEFVDDLLIGMEDTSGGAKKTKKSRLRGKQRQYTNLQLQFAVYAVKYHGMSYSQASDSYGVPATTLFGHVKDDQKAGTNTDKNKKILRLAAKEELAVAAVRKEYLGIDEAALLFDLPPEFVRERAEEDEINEDFEENVLDKEELFDSCTDRCPVCLVQLNEVLLPHHIWSAHKNKAKAHGVKNPFFKNGQVSCPVCSKNIIHFHFKMHLIYVHGIKCPSDVKISYEDFAGVKKIYSWDKTNMGMANFMNMHRFKKRNVSALKMYFPNVSDKEKTKVPCPFCDRYIAANTFNKHCRRHKNRHTCPYCGEMMTSSLLRNHHILTVHQVVLDSWCNSKDGKRIPSSVKSGKVVCDFCERSFDRLYDLKVHVKCEHLNLKEHSCDICGAKFKRQSYVNSHKLTVHYNVALYKCTICSETFKKSNLCKKHVKDVHNIEVKGRLNNPSLVGKLPIVRLNFDEEEYKKQMQLRDEEGHSSTTQNDLDEVHRIKIETTDEGGEVVMFPLNEATIEYLGGSDDEIGSREEENFSEEDKIWSSVDEDEDKDDDEEDDKDDEEEEEDDDYQEFLE